MKFVAKKDGGRCLLVEAFETMGIVVIDSGHVGLGNRTSKILVS
jgi:hypothetical protein